ncbi:MAG: hypothetical protein ACK5NT_09935 [Pyrinomonadaceae bacterium]
MELIEHPKITEKKEEIAALKNLLAKYIEEYENLRVVQIPLVKAAYFARFGELLRAILVMKFEAAAMKRRIEMVRAALVVGKDIDSDEIESRIKKELGEELKAIKKAEKRLNDALKLMDSQELTTEENERLRRAYRNLAKKLHPDLNAVQDEKTKNLWLIVTEAYQNGDYLKLEELELVIDEIPDEALNNKESNSLNKLTQIAKKVRKMVEAKVLQSLKLKENEHLDEYDILDDEIAVSSREAELNERLEKYTDLFDSRVAVFQNLLKSIGFDNQTQIFKEESDDLIG